MARGLGFGLAGGLGLSGSHGHRLDSGLNIDSGTAQFGGYVYGTGGLASFSQSNSGGGSAPIPTGGRGFASVGTYGGAFVGDYNSATFSTPDLVCSSH